MTTIPSVSDFSKREACLRRLGNLRMPYMVYVSKSADNVDCIRSMLGFQPVALHLRDCAESIDDHILDFASSCKEPMLIVYAGNASCAVPCFDMFNELVFGKNGTERLVLEWLESTFECFDKQDCLVYKRKTLQLGSIRAMASKHIVINGHRAEPWETLYRVLGTDICFLAIWDTRLITAVAELPGHDFAQHADANDNGRKFYMPADVASTCEDATLEQLRPFIGAYV